MSSRGKEEEGYSVEANENMLVLINNFKESLIPIGSEEANKNVFATIKILIKGVRRRLVDLGNVDAPEGPLKIQLMIFNKEHIPLVMEQLKEEGFKTFYVPQSKIGDMDDYVKGFKYGCYSDNVDYIGVSILGVPNAFGGIEKDNKLQRFASRQRLYYELATTPFLDTAKHLGKKFHFLGMVDGPNEIMFMNPFRKFIDTWDSSAAVWAGLNGLSFDDSPTGLVDGKFEKEVDFNFETNDYGLIQMAKKNMQHIDGLVWGYLWEN